MCEFVRYFTRFSFWLLIATTVILMGLAAALLAVPHLLLQGLCYGAAFLCIGLAFTIAISLVYAMQGKR